MAKELDKAKKKAKAVLNRLIKEKKLTGIKIGFANDVDFDYGKEATPFPSINGMIAGGLPRGKLTIISGPPGSCKTTLAAQSLAYAQAQDPNMLALWVDVEHCWDTKWMQTLGIDIDRVIVAELLESLEDTLDLVIAMCKEMAVGYIVYDSIGAIASKGEFESKKGISRSMKEDTVGLGARQFNKFLRIATPRFARADCVIILIAQVYTDINSYGGIDVVKGGNGIAHHAHLRLLTRRVKDDDKIVKIKMPGATVKSNVRLGWNINVKVDKSKQSGTEGYSIVLPFTLGIGIIAAEAAIITAIQMGMIDQAGAWFKWGKKKFQGKANVIKYFMENDEEYGSLTNMMKDIASEEMIKRITEGDYTPDDEDEEDIEEDEIL